MVNRGYRCWAPLGLVLGLFLTASPVLAHESGSGEQSCREDAEKFCKDVQPGGGRIINCLSQHKDELSGDCRAKWEAKEEGARWPCRDDAEKFCKDVKPGEGRIIECLKQHKGELSPACKEKGVDIRNKVDAAARGMKEACEGDLQRFCKDVQPGGGRIVQCLKEHKDGLSESCKRFGHEIREKREEMSENRGHIGAAAAERMQSVQDACRDDYQKFCGDVQPGGGRIMSCMKQHSSQLSGACGQMFHAKEGAEKADSDEGKD